MFNLVRPEDEHGLSSGAIAVSIGDDSSGKPCRTPVAVSELSNDVAITASGIGYSVACTDS